MKKFNKNLVAYCGLYCGNCFSHTGQANQLSKDITKIIQDNKFNGNSNIVPFIEPNLLNKYYKWLRSKKETRCKKACRDNDQRSCKIKECCTLKEFEGCWECDKYENCDKMEFLKIIHNDAHIKNMRAIREIGIDEWILNKK